MSVLCLFLKPIVWLYDVATNYGRTRSNAAGSAWKWDQNRKRRSELKLEQMALPVDKWLAAIPRPERSGTLGIATALLILYGLAVPIAAGGDLSVLCEVMPWKCETPASAMQRAHEPRYRVVHLLFYGHPSGGPGPCVCHRDFDDGSEIHHLSTGPDAPACDSDGPAPWERQWETLEDCLPANGTACLKYTIFVPSGPTNGYARPQGREYEAVAGNRIRWHCTDDARYLREYGEIIEAKPR